MVARAITRSGSERSMKRAERVEASVCRHWPVRPHMVYIAAWIETNATSKASEQVVGVKTDTAASLVVMVNAVYSHKRQLMLRAIM